MRRTVAMAMAMDGTCLDRTLWSSSATTRPARWRVFKQLAAAGRLVGFASWLAGSPPPVEARDYAMSHFEINNRTRVLAADSRVRLMTTRSIRSS